MNPIDVEAFFAVMDSRDHTIFTDGTLNIVGYRSLFGRPNYYDDIISVYQRTPSGWVIKHYQATTRPGVPYLKKPINPKGAAILVAGQYKDSYILGLHRTRYKALVQVLPVNVYRDNNYDEKFDEGGKLDQGLFGINIHRASLKNMIVGADSAGCQVIRNRSDYDEFIAWCEASRQKRFTYTLIEI